MAKRGRTQDYTPLGLVPGAYVCFVYLPFRAPLQGF